MNDHLLTENILDELARQGITRTEAEERLRKAGVGDVAGEIDLHLAAAKILQRNAIRMQVASVHGDFIRHQDKSITQAEPVKTARVLNLRWVTRVAASLVLVASAWFTYQYMTTTSAGVYGEIYQPYTINTDRGFGEPLAHDMVPAFQKKDYAAVIAAYESLSTTNNREKFLAAFAYLETGKAVKAIPLLEKILEENRLGGSKLYQDEAEFYLALSYLKNQQTDQAIVLFKTIRAQPNHTFHDRVDPWVLRKMNWLR